MQNLITIVNESIFLLAAILLISGYIFGQIAKLIRIPRVTGYIIAGIILGPSILRLFNEFSISQLDFIPQIALGMIAVIIGAGLSFNLIKKLGLSVAVITVLQALGAFVLSLFFLMLFKMPLEAALPLAVIATATDPATTIAVIKEYRARGTFTETVMAVVALDDAVAIILFGLVLTIDLKHISTFGETAIHSLSASALEIFTALLLGAVLGAIAYFIIKFIKDAGDSLIVMFAFVLLAVGLANIFHTSTLLTCMFLGLALINISPKNEDPLESLSRITPLIYCFFFVLAGAHLDLRIFFTAGTLLMVWGVVFVLTRIAGKVGGAYIGGVVSNANEVIRKYLGWTLIPQAGVAVGLPLMITASSSYYDFKSMILNITLVAVAFNVVIGPIFTKHALFAAKEATIEEE